MQMQVLLPDGFLTLSESARRFEHAIFAGRPERQLVDELRTRLGLAIGDGISKREAKRQMWTAVDDGSLRLVAIGGSPRQTIEVDAAVASGIPLLKNGRAGGLTYLRPSNLLHTQFIGWFGINLSEVVLAFREKDVERAIHRLRRRSRRTGPAKLSGGPAGRPSRQLEVKHAIAEIMKRCSSKSVMTNKELANKVNRRLKQTVSDPTVSRARASLYRETGDRLYARASRRLP